MSNMQPLEKRKDAMRRWYKRKVYRTKYRIKKFLKRLTYRVLLALLVVGGIAYYLKMLPQVF